MKKTNSAAAVLAMFSMLAAPVAAAERPRAQSPQPIDVAPIAGEGSMTAERHRRYRYRRNRGIDAGDVLTGILIIGGIAAITDAARDAERERERRRRDRDYDYENDRDYRAGEYDRDYADRREADRYARSVSPSQAAEACLDEVRDLGDAQDIDLVRRAGDGWQVEGRMDDGTPYSCAIGADGSVREIGRSSDMDEPYADRGDAQADIDYAALRERRGDYAYRAPEAGPSGEIDGDLGG